MQAESSRRSHERRQHERRVNCHPFNSTEWLAVILEEYALWPKYDRRISDRRDGDRRHMDRREKKRNGGSLVRRAHLYANKTRANQVLNDDEKAMILTLFRDEDSA